MKNINFLLFECTFLRYFIPIVIEANKRNIKSNFFIKESNKYNCPHKYKNQLDSLLSTHNACLHDIKDFRKFDGLTFLIEGVGREYISKNKHFVVSITYMSDFIGLYEQYIEDVNAVIFPSSYFANYYATLNHNKNYYLGSPKYDCRLNYNEILKKYDFDKNQKRILIIFPRTRDLNKINLEKIYNISKELKYEIIVKTRGKDLVLDEKLKGDKYFIDYSWYPHTTLELIKVCDLVINFNSTVVKECVMLEKPIINFNIKPIKPLEFLYNGEYCMEITSDDLDKDLVNAIDYLHDNKFSYKEAQKKYLFNPNKNVSREILDEFFCYDLT